MALAAALAAVALGGSPAGAQSPATFTVQVGVSSPHGAVQGFGFYPGIITINAGDTVTWVLHSSEPHTVLFTNGAQIAPGSPAVMAPSGGSTFSTTGVFSSGLLFQGQTYSLTFPTAGVYVYQCGLHPDMEGAVVVLPAGQALPYSAAQIYAQGQSQMQEDLNAGYQAAALTTVTTSPGANGTTVYHVPSDVASPSTWTVPLASSSNPAVGGLATLDVTGPTTLSVSLSLSGLSASATYTAAIQAATTSSDGVLIDSLNSVTSSAAGSGTSQTALSGLFGIPGHLWFIVVRDASGNLIASGPINYPDYGSLRYFPAILTIHVGDQVVWSEPDVHEIHTVTFLAHGQTAPVFGTPASTAPADGSVVRGHTFFNSGVIGPGQTYSLTFDAAGTYDYTCLLHDDLGMNGVIVVLAKTYTVRSGDTLRSIALSQLGSASLWSEIYSANRAEIGPDPNLIRVGQVLQMP